MSNNVVESQSRKPLTLQSWIRLLKAWGACAGNGEALPWLRSLPAITTPEEAYNACPRGDWLLWLAGRVGVEPRTIVLVACAIARTALGHVQPGEERPRIAIETTEAWTRGEATIEEERAAGIAAARAASAAPDPGAAYAAHAAAIASHATVSCYVTVSFSAGTHAAAASTDAARAAACAAAYTRAAATAATALAARQNAHAEHAVIVRRLIPWSVIAAAISATSRETGNE